MWIVFALLASLFFGIRGIMYQWTSQEKINRNLLLFGVFFVGFIISLSGMIIFEQQWYGWPDVAVGLALGIGSFAGNAFLHKGFSVGKTAIISILSGLTPLFVLVFAFLLWQETLTTLQLFGFCIIFIGLYIIRYSNDISINNLQGAQWGLLAALFFSFNDLLSKQSTRLEADTFATLTAMFSFGSLLFAISWLTSRKQELPESSKNNDLQAHWSGIKTFSAGLFIGLTNVAGMFFPHIRFCHWHHRLSFGNFWHEYFNYSAVLTHGFKRLIYPPRAYWLNHRFCRCYCLEIKLLTIFIIYLT